MQASTLIQAVLNARPFGLEGRKLGPVRPDPILPRLLGRAVHCQLLGKGLQGLAPAQHPGFRMIAPSDPEPAGADDDPIAGDDPLLGLKAATQGEPFLERLHGPHPVKQRREVVVTLHIAG